MPHTFPDHFSGHASDYAAHRPRYPAALYRWIASQAPGRDLVWDAATGSGQAAVALTDHFSAVHATDASAKQLAAATPHQRVRYACEPAERCSLADASVDAVTVAQALHWFDHERFFAEAVRVLKPEGLFVAWCYELLSVDPAVDAAIVRFYEGAIGPYWPPQRRHIEVGYRDIALPFPERAAPEFAMTMDWDREALLAYLGTWSAVRRHDADTGARALDSVQQELAAIWPVGERRRVRFPLSLRSGRRLAANDTAASVPSR